MIDQYEPTPSSGWPRWMERQIREADFVLIVCTETYYRRVVGQEEPDKGLGVCWEANLIYNCLYRQKLEESGPVVGEYPQSVRTTWSLNFVQVAKMSQAVADLLSVTAFLDPDQIPFELFTLGAQELGPNLATALTESDSFKIKERRYEEAEPIFRRSVEILTKILGIEHPNTQTCLENLVALYKSQNQVAAARELRKKLIK
jgi:hypothetical protein